VLEPELEQAKKEIGDLAVDMDDVLIYALYPVTGKRFLKWKYGKEQPPADLKPRTLEDVAAEREWIRKAMAGELVEKPKKQAPAKSDHLRTFNIFVDDEYFEVGVEEIGGAPTVTYVQPDSSPKTAVPRMRVPASAPAMPETANPAADVEGTPLSAPMPGMILNYQKNVGDSVNEGDTIVILEAMKMENALPAPTSGTIKAINFISGDSVVKGDVLAIIG
jgi:oxaloacetate decarboxylase alpha subunit/pyruvate carboxylase subunit B